MLASSPIWSLSCCTCRSRGARSSLRLTWYFGGLSRCTCPAGCGAATRPDRLAGRSQGVWTLSSSRELASAAPGSQRRGGATTTARAVCGASDAIMAVWARNHCSRANAAAAGDGLVPGAIPGRLSGGADRTCSMSLSASRTCIWP